MLPSQEVRAVSTGSNGSARRLVLPGGADDVPGDNDVRTRKNQSMSGRQIACLAALVSIFLIHAVYLNAVAEDAFITFRFARHVADGHGFVWNIGEAPVEGYTNFLWLMLGALILRVGLDIVLASQVLGVAASLVTMVYTYLFARRFLDVPGGYALIPCVFLAVSGPFATWSASGMETNLFGTLLLLASYHFASWSRFESRAILAICFLTLFLATLTRPEGFVVFGLFAGMAAALFMATQRGAVRRDILVLMVYVIPFLVYFLWRYSLFGFLLPNTFYAKTGGTVYQYLRGASYSALFVWHFIVPLVPVFVALVWEKGWGVYPGGVYPGRVGRSFAHHIRLHVGSYVCVLMSTVFGLYIIYVGGDYMAMYRFFVPVLPFVYLLFGLATHRLFLAIVGSGRKRLVATGLVAGAVGLTAVQSTPIEQRLFAKPWFMHGTYRGVQFERLAVARHTLIAKFFNDRKGVENSSVALLYIGVIPYYTAMTTHSIYGIVDAHIAHNATPQRPIGLGFPGHEKQDVRYALSKRPTYIVVSSRLHAEAESYREYPDEIKRDEIGDDILKDYRLVSVWLLDSVKGEAGFFTFLELKANDA